LLADGLLIPSPSSFYLIFSEAFYRSIVSFIWTLQGQQMSIAVVRALQTVFMHTVAASSYFTAAHTASRSLSSSLSMAQMTTPLFIHLGTSRHLAHASLA
jgi:hypothetical protein